jgi:DNA-binding response OmpR family regulator
MNILLVEDDPLSRLSLARSLEHAGHAVTQAAGGQEAADAFLRLRETLDMVILDWMLPDLEGIEVCRRIRQAGLDPYVYVIMVTARTDKADVVAGLNAGADDYLVKPVDWDELAARVGVGARVVLLERQLRRHVRDLETALAEVRQLRGLLPICSYCKNIRDDSHYWQSVETYLTSRADVSFSHAICPACWKKHVEPQLAHLDGPPPAPG